MLNILNIIETELALSGGVSKIYYCPIFGKCKVTLCENKNIYAISVNNKSTTILLDKYGRADENGEVLIFPSRIDRKWKKVFIPNHNVVVYNDLLKAYVIGKYIKYNSKEDFHLVLVGEENIISNNVLYINEINE